MLSIKKDTSAVCSTTKSVAAATFDRVKFLKRFFLNKSGTINCMGIGVAGFGIPGVVMPYASGPNNLTLALNNGQIIDFTSVKSEIYIFQSNGSIAVGGETTTGSSYTLGWDANQKLTSVAFSPDKNTPVNMIACKQ